MKLTAISVMGNNNGGEPQVLDVLLVDDDDIMAFSFGVLLRHCKFKTKLTTSSRGEEVISILTTIINEGGKLPDFIFLDLNMPKIGGWEILEELSNLGLSAGSIFICVLSSSILPAEIERADMNPLVSTFHTKPIDVNTLNEILGKNT